MKCKFHAMCGKQATTQRYHTYQKQVLNVCDHCAATNEYLVSVDTVNEAARKLGAAKTSGETLDALRNLCRPTSTFRK